MSTLLAFYSVTFGPETVDIAYQVLPDDIKQNGLQKQSILRIPRGSDYEDEIYDAEEAIRALLEDAVEDLSIALAIVPRNLDEEEEDEEDE